MKRNVKSYIVSILKLIFRIYSKQVFLYLFFFCKLLFLYYNIDNQFLLEGILLKNLEERVFKIEERNRRVELDKEWETCWTRKICIMILTYIVVLIYSYLVRRYDNIFLSSLVPVIGFTLSTLSLKFVRKVWESKK